MEVEKKVQLSAQKNSPGSVGANLCHPLNNGHMTAHLLQALLQSTRILTQIQQPLYQLPAAQNHRDSYTQGYCSRFPDEGRTKVEGKDKLKAMAMVIPAVMAIVRLKGIPMVGVRLKGTAMAERASQRVMAIRMVMWTPTEMANQMANEMQRAIQRVMANSMAKETERAIQRVMKRAMVMETLTGRLL